MTATTRSCIRYVIRHRGVWIGDANSRDEADIVVFIHANRHRRAITDGYAISVELREEAE